MICPACRADNSATAEHCIQCGRPLLALTAGTVIAGRYEIQSHLGRGGMGTVYKAYDRSLDEVVALKVLRSDVALQPDMARRFRSEIKLARKIGHKHVCRIHDYGESGGLHFISMAFVDGVDLKEILRTQGALPWDEGYDLAIQAVEGLQAIHEHGIVHRDVKSQNIMRDSRGVVRLMDFGIAKEWGAETASGVTAAGHIVGTPDYMSPEQIRGDKVDFRSDIYAIGLVIFEIFTGWVPFHAETPIATIFKRLNEPLSLDVPQAKHLPPELRPVLQKALASDPGGRYASARELADALREARSRSSQGETGALLRSEDATAVRGATSVPGATTAVSTIERAAVRPGRRLIAVGKWLAPPLVLVAGAWWFVLVPRWVEDLYGKAVEDYRAGDYAAATANLQRARALNPRVSRVNILMGWSQMRLGRPQDAQLSFARARRSEPTSEEAELGLALADLALDRSADALSLLRELGGKHPEERETQMALGEAYVKAGANLEAARFYRSLLDRHPDDREARSALLQIFGHPEDAADQPPAAPGAIQRPAELQVRFRAHGDFLQGRIGGGWQDIYPLGVNLGPARPGEFPSTASRDFSTYSAWLSQIAAMHANTVRAYTVLPPAFYQALLAHNRDTPSPLWLVQEVWLRDEARDLYEPETDEDLRGGITDTIDLLHGHADIGFRRGHAFGIYSADVSPYVLALAVGREVEPSVVQLTNVRNPSQTAYRGRYVSIDRGTPAEAWFARMCDFAVQFETEKYNMQHPVTVVNWPPLDPLDHPTEATRREEIKIRRRLGEEVPEEVAEGADDADAVSLDVNRFRAEAGFAAGLFALYHVYPHWPDFLLNEPAYALARDAEGPNRYLGYLRDLKQAHTHIPLLVGEYGVSTSLGVAHLHPQGWSNGGLSETQQAAVLGRFTRNIRDAGCAGSLVFEWSDEWFKHVHDEYTADFERPWDRKPLWLNVLDPEEAFGIVGWEPDAVVPLLRGNPDDWKDAQLLYSGRAAPGDGRTGGALRALNAMSDYAYLYVRLDVDPRALDWKTVRYWVALNTLPGQSGSKTLPGIPVRMDAGANFLLELAGPKAGRILVSENYDPNQRVAVPGRPGQSQIQRKRAMAVGLVDAAPFEEMINEVNRPRYARDGRVFPALEVDRSPLPYGNADRTAPGFLDHALWNADYRTGMIELRIPWGLLLVADPSSLLVFAGTDEAANPLSRRSPEIAVAVLALRTSPGGSADTVVEDSFPAVRDGSVVGLPATFAWKGWNEVRYRPYVKRGYAALQRVFAEIGAAQGRHAPASSRSQSAGSS